jgi:hypothetical protein
MQQWSSYTIVLSWTQYNLLDQSMVEHSRTWDSPKSNDANMWIVGDSLTVLDVSSSSMIKVCIVMTPISYDWSYTEYRSHLVLIDRYIKELADVFGEKRLIDNSTISLLFVIIECSSSYGSYQISNRKIYPRFYKNLNSSNIHSFLTVCISYFMCTTVIIMWLIQSKSSAAHVLSQQLSLT